MCSFSWCKGDLWLNSQILCFDSKWAFFEKKAKHYLAVQWFKKTNVLAWFGFWAEGCKSLDVLILESLSMNHTTTWILSVPEQMYPKICLRENASSWPLWPVQRFVHWCIQISFGLLVPYPPTLIIFRL